MNIDLGAAPDFPHGKSTHGGWYCRACGDEIFLNDQIWKPKGTWICDKCYQSGNHNATAQAHKNQRRATAPPPPPPSAAQKTASAWDNLFGGPQAGPQPGNTGQFRDDTFHQQKPKSAPPADSSVETVNEDNWIEIIFELIPDKHLKRVFSSLSRTYHPDIGGSEREQQRINDAFHARRKENGK